MTEDHKGECGGTCPVCIRTRRMVSAVIADSLNEIVNLLCAQELDDAQTHVAAFLAVLDEIPHSTSELIGHDNIENLREVVERGFSEIRNREGHAAEAVFRCALNAWYGTYPPYQA